MLEMQLEQGKSDLADLLTEKEAAAVLDVSVSFLQKSRVIGCDDILNGKAPPFEKDDGQVRYRLEELISFLQRSKQGMSASNAGTNDSLAQPVEWLTEQEVAKMLAKSESWLQKSRQPTSNLIGLGKAPPFYRVGRSIKYSLGDVKRVLSQPNKTEQPVAVNEDSVWSSWFSPNLLTSPTA